ncbi:MAG TPA: glycosyltransferase family 2 protein [Anaerolineales bacterium]
MAGIAFWLCVFFVFYVYAGYPLLIAVLARLRPKPVWPPQELPRVTLLIAAHNEEKAIESKLINTAALDYPRDRLQILIADDGSVDRTAEIVQAYAPKGIQLFRIAPRRGKMAALNLAMKEVRNEIVLFSDADNLYSPDAVRKMVEPFSDPSVGAVSGGREVPGERALGKAEGLYWKYEEFIKRQESRLGSCVAAAGDAFAIRRQLFLPPPPDIINDDFFLVLEVLKQHYRVVYAPGARSTHPVTETETGEIERRARMVAGRYQAIFKGFRMLPFGHPVVVWQIISHKYLRPIVPLAVILAMIANAIAFVLPSRLALPGWLVLARPYVWITLALEVLFFALAALGVRRRFPGIIGRVLYLPTFLINSNFAALKGLYRYLTEAQTVFWTRPRDELPIKKGEASPRR